MNAAAVAVRLCTALATFVVGTLVYSAFETTPPTRRTEQPPARLYAAPTAQTCSEQLRSFLDFESNAAARVDQADRLEESECYSEAETLLRDAVRLDPSYARAHFYLGYLYSELGRFEEAAEALERGLRLDPKDAWANGEMGYVLNALGRPSQAVPPLMLDLGAEPEDAFVRSSLSDSFLQLKRRPEAYRYAREAMRLGAESSDVPALDNATTTLIELARNDSAREAEAEEAARLALEAEPGGLYPSFMLGLVTAVRGREAESVSGFIAAADAQPDEPFEYIMRGWARLHVGRAGEAAEDARHLLRLVEWKGQHAGDAAVLEYFALRREGREDEAARVLEEAAARFDASTFDGKLVRCLRGDLSDGKLFAAAQGEFELTAAHGYVGLKYALDGDGGWMPAVKNIAWVRDNGTRQFVAYAYALAELKNLRINY